MKKSKYLLKIYSKPILSLLGVVLIFGLNSCASNWFLTPREKSIKEWESQHGKTEEKESDSIQRWSGIYTKQKIQEFK
ncbi:hypothetical protein ACFSQJ_11050 [Croceitalea marina]|uniref:Lipoprotein n=1 Tax=Croceitalea marina TaxID=1775166 RepID=A0ABW5MWA6_9FLAO